MNKYKITLDLGFQEVTMSFWGTSIADVFWEASNFADVVDIEYE